MASERFQPTSNSGQGSLVGGYSSADAENAQTPTQIVLRLDPTTKRLLVDVNGATPVTDGEAVNAADTGTLILGTDGANYQVISTDASGHLQVDVLTGGGGGTLVTDGEAVDVADTGVLILGTDGTNYQILHTDSDGNLQVDILSGAGGTQYTEGDIDASVTGTALMWEDGSDTLRVVSAAKPLPVDTEMPAAISLVIDTATPTAPPIGAFMMGYDYAGGANWNPVRVDGFGIMDTRPAGSESVGLQQDSADGYALRVTGGIAHDAVDGGAPQKIGGYASAAAPTSVSADADRVNAWFLRNGAQAMVLTAAGALIGGDATNGLDVDVTRSALPTGASTLAEQQSQTTHLATIAGDTTAIETAIQIIDDWDNGASDGASVSGDVAHDSADAGEPVKIGGKATDVGAAITVANNDRTNGAFLRNGLQLGLGGAHDTISKNLNVTDADGAQTDTALITVSAGTAIVVTKASAMLDAATTATGGVAVRIGFGTANTPAADSAGIILAHPGIAAGSGVVEGNGSGIIGIGASNEDLRLTCEDPAGGNLDIIITYFTIAIG